MTPYVNPGTSETGDAENQSLIHRGTRRERGATFFAATRARTIASLTMATSVLLLVTLAFLYPSTSLPPSSSSTSSSSSSLDETNQDDNVVVPDATPAPTSPEEANATNATTIITIPHATDTPTPTSAPRPHIRNRPELFLRKVPGAYKMETHVAYRARVRQWEANLEAYLNATSSSPNIFLRGEYPQEGGGDSNYLMRTAISMEDGKLYAIPIQYVPNSVKDNKRLRARMLNTLCFVVDAPLQPAPDEDPRPCSCYHINLVPGVEPQVTSSYVVCKVSEAATAIATSGREKELVFIRPGEGDPRRRETLRDAIRVTVERPESRGDAGFTVCMQHTVHETRDRIPYEFFRDFVNHYVSYGATDFHFYTDSLVGVDRLLRAGAEAVKSSTNPPRINIHDTPLPPHTNVLETTIERRYRVDYLQKHLRVEREEATLEAIKSDKMLTQEINMQLFIAGDCLARTKASGAKWTLIVDLDEFVVPRPRAPGVRETSLPSAWDPEPFNLLWMDSIMMDTTGCAQVEGAVDGGDASDVRDRYLWGKFDGGVYRNRRKGVLRIEALDSMQVLGASWMIHDAIGVSNQTALGVNTRASHIHHFRGGPFIKCKTFFPPTQDRSPDWIRHDPGGDCPPYPKNVGNRAVTPHLGLG